MDERSLTLYEISTEIQALEKILQLDEGEITEEFEALQKEVFLLIEKKTDNCAYFINMLEDEITAADERIKKLNAFKNARKGAIERFKTYVASCMEACNTNQFKGTFCTFSKRKPSQVVEIENEDKLPVEFVKVEIIPDKTMIKNSIKSGVDVPGAKLVDGKSSIQITMRGVK